MGLFQNGLGWFLEVIDKLLTSLSLKSDCHIALNQFFLNWLGQEHKDFIAALVSLLEILWEISILPVLRAAFGAFSILYGIFYAGFVAGVIFVEFWDPNHMNPKSEVCKISEAPKDNPLPNKREDSQVFMLTI
ncbi:MAG: hypothetical protein JJU32_19765 [Phormidium sp. BM_Day4_Bin.17]|nr:hypothetical protein [Phormidium sp. BM_Day4_Bin.17]UCJ10681.1 MAG: hypothetical protein JWS08_12625 [Phormidium sp. PBR-2020]